MIMLGVPFCGDRSPTYNIASLKRNFPAEYPPDKNISCSVGNKIAGYGV